MTSPFRNHHVRHQYLVRGVVQGVGFRPTVATIASRHQITGLCGNDDQQVFIEAQGTTETLDDFWDDLQSNWPPLAIVLATTVEQIPTLDDETGFTIVPSHHEPGVRTLISPDVATCDDCLAEMRDPTDRRYRYPFTNCTNCGPRLSIIKDLPYDRPATTMAEFELCDICLAEYTNPHDRRFHAQPVCCPECGPKLWVEESHPELVNVGGFLVGDSGVEPAAGSFTAESIEEAAVAGPIKETLSTDPSREVSAADPIEGASTVDPIEETSTADPIKETLARIAAGQIVAVKGLGGFHLMCDARNASAVGLLRERKRRVAKPFAVMVADVAQAEKLARLSIAQRAALTSPARPIVIAAMTADYDLCEQVAPGRNEVGLLLPYTPLHHLLFEDPELVLVATSGNLSEEPLCYRNEDARERLSSLVDAMLLHDRGIHVPVEDSVLMADSDGEIMPVRRSRGYAPLPMQLPVLDQGTLFAGSGSSVRTESSVAGTGIRISEVAVAKETTENDNETKLATPSDPVVLATGGELKNAAALAVDDWAHLAAHLGEMGSLASQQAFEASVNQLVAMRRAEPEVVVADLHPGYSTHTWAQKYVHEHPGVELVEVQHHLAHGLSLLAEHQVANGRVIVGALDGTGYGTDGTIWGGEILRLDLDARPITWSRVDHVPCYPLVGGDRAVKYPWRVALGLATAWDFDIESTPAVQQAPAAELKLVRSQLATGFGVVQTSSTGRLFDAAAALTGICLQANYEAQPAILFEQAAGGLDVRSYPPEGVTLGGLSESRDVTIDHPREVFIGLIEDRAQPLARRAWFFHAALASWFATRLKQQAITADTKTIGLTGGVLANRLFTRLLTTSLRADGYTVLTHHVVPANDGGLALGQVWAGRLAAQVGIREV